MGFVARKSGLEVINMFSCSTQLSMKFILFINVIIVGILTLNSTIKYNI